MRTKFKIGDNAVIKVGSIVGMVVGADIKYEVAFPDKDGYPCRGTFFELELGKVDNNKPMGFSL